MPHHEWEDEWFEKNGDDLYRAMTYIRKYVRRLSLCKIMMKEKYGTIRYEIMFPPGGAISYRTFDRVLQRLFGMKKVFYKDLGKYSGSDHYYAPRVIWIGSWLYHQWVKLGHWALKKALKNACKKFPNVKEEILWDIDIGEDNELII